jgi:polyisoprenoid-binding protein YceI
MNAATTGTSATLKPTQWQIDPAHSAAHFSVRHLMISNVRGEFGKVGGNVVLDPSDLTKSTVEVSVDTATIDTREPQRDEHLRSADFFDVANHPAITFRSKRITAAGTDRFKVTGDLTIRGVTREVTFDVEGPVPAIKDPLGNVRTGISATAKINRKDFGLVWNMLTEAGGVVVGDEVSIAFESELIQKAPAGDAK